MPFDRFLIAPINTGLQTDLKPWLIPDDAFEKLSNVYVFRGRIRKRFGGILMGTGSSSLTAPLSSRLRIQVNTTDAGGNAAGFVPGVIFKVGQMFSIAGEMYTVFNPAAGPQTMLDTIGATAVKTYDIGTGAYNFVGAMALTPVFFYPAEPVMGLTVYESGPINNQPSYAFDTQFAYTFNGSWQRSQTGGNPIWHGNDLNFFWTTNWNGTSVDQIVMFVTNFQVTNPNGAVVGTDDPIWSFNLAGAGWVSFSPTTVFLTAGNFVKTARIIVPFKDRLLLLNTIEVNAANTVNTAFPQRCRFSHNGSPFSTNAWLEPNQTFGGANADGAGFIDAATEEKIVSAEFIKDRLIVYFEQSTWELAYTGNEVLPFVWQKINTELGSEATFSSVPFDKVILTIGNTGVHACNGANVERIDNKIPDQIFEIRDKNEGVKRIAGVRDYFTEMVYWTFPGTNERPAAKFPNQVLVYNYRTGSWALNDDCITAFGYFEQQTDTTWSSTTLTWEEFDAQWISGIIQAQFRQIIAGNQQGFVFVLRPDISRNAAVMQITNMVVTGGINITATIIDHTLSIGDFIAIENAQGIVLSAEIFEVTSIIDTNTIVLGNSIFTGVYAGGGTATRVSNINILSKQWNPYINKGKNVYLARIDFGVTRTSDGEIQVDYAPSSTELSMVNDGTATGTILGDGVLETKPYDANLYPLEQEQKLLWHPIYFQSTGEFIQVNLSFNLNQITNPEIAWEEFEIQGLVLHTSPSSDRLQ